MSWEGLTNRNLAPQEIAYPDGYDVAPSPIDRWGHRRAIYHPSLTTDKEAIYQALGKFGWC